MSLEFCPGQRVGLVDLSVLQYCPMYRLKHPFRLLAIILPGLLLLCACTVQPERLPAGAIPMAAAPTLLEDEHADEVVADLSEDYVLDTGSQQYYRLLDLFSRITRSAGVNPDDWQVYLFDAPDVIDVRAIHGNTILVWSGLFDVVNGDDELAGLLTWELAHGMARHTAPVEFNLGSELLFGMTDIAASIGLMVLTQGVVAVSGIGMTRWLYVEASDLDELDRVYNREQVEETAEIVLLVLDSSEFSPAGLLQFWQRAGSDPELGERLQRLGRKMTPAERVAILEAAMTLLPGQQEAASGVNVPLPDQLPRS